MPLALPGRLGAFGLLAALAISGCAAAPLPPDLLRAAPAATPAAPAATTPGQVTASPEPEAVPAAVEPLARAVPAVAPLAARVPADLLVTSDTPLPADIVKGLDALDAADATVLRIGVLQLDGAPVAAVGVDPSRFRAFAPQGTAESDAVWSAVARGEAVPNHAVAQQRHLPLGGTLPVSGPSGARTVRLGAVATTNLPGADVVVDQDLATALGLPPDTGMVLSAHGGDPEALAGAARRVLGDRLGASARIDLLSAPRDNPVAFLSGSKAAKAFGAFSYRYFADGTIEPDAAWVDANIRTETVPIFGKVTCHRLMLPQLREALQEVVDAGLAGTLHSYDGCYVPRFIESNPSRSISLHTWGIAIDLDAATNYRGIRGTMDPRVVAIFKKWGFAWGGDWGYTDPMHFQLAALLDKPAH